MTEDEMVGWHHQFDGHEFEQALGPGDGHGSLVCHSPWGRKESETSLSLFIFRQRRRKWQPTPVFLPGESHSQRSLVGYSPWGHKEADTTE